MTTSSANNSVFRGFFEKQKLTGPNFIDWYRQLRIVLSIEDKLNYLEQPIPPALVAPVDSVFPASRAGASSDYERFSLLQAGRRAIKRLGHPITLSLGVSLILIGLRKEYDGFVPNYNMHKMGKIVNELHAMLKLHEQTLPKNNAPALNVIRTGKVQKASGAGGSGIFIIELNTILNRSWIYDTGCGIDMSKITKKRPKPDKNEHEIMKSIQKPDPKTFLCTKVKSSPNSQKPKSPTKEEQAAQIFTPYWNFSMINDNEEHSIQYKEYLKNSSNAIAPVLPTKEPEYSLSMGYEHLSTISKTESDEVIKSSVKNLLQIPSEYEVTSDDESDDDESLSNENVSMENFKSYSNPFFDDEEINSNKIDPHYFNAESDLIESLSNRDTLFDSSPKFDYLEEFSDELMPTSIVNKERIESDDYDSERDIHFLEELLVNDSIPLPENESSNFDHHDDTLFPRPPSKPLDVEFFFDFKPNSGELISVVMNNIYELNDEKCFDPGGSEIDVFANVEDDDYFPFIFSIRIFLSYLTYLEVSPLLLSTGSEDTIFNPGSGISSGWNFHVL
nr:zinc finger, CCHC-type [Tanacetum cinerariifolium]